MKDVFHSTAFKILVAVVAAMFCLMLYTAGAGDSATATALGLITTPMQRVSAIVANNAAAAARTAAQPKEELEAENRRLRQQVEDLNKKLVNYYAYQQENAQLRKFLELKNDNPDFKLVAAAVIGRDPNDLFGQFTLDQGSRAGIALNDPVVTEAGVVGWVSSLSAGYSKVTTFLAPETKISAMDRVSRETGVVGCDIRAADRSLLQLNYLSAGTAVKAGDLIVTSGIGGIYPRNLIIGTVKDVKHSTYDVSLYAEVEPAVDVKAVRDVLVITSFTGQGEALSPAGGKASSSSAGGKP